MFKNRKKLVIFLLILIQSLISVAAGLALAFLLSNNRMPSGVHVENVNVGGLSKSEASKKLNQSLSGIIDCKSFKIKCENKIYEIKYSDIDGAIDSRATVDTAYGHGEGQLFTNFFAGSFSLKKKVISPVVTFNEGKLREKLNDFNIILNRSKKNASIHVEGDRVVKVPETVGYRFNIKNAIDKIRKDLNLRTDAPIEFKVSHNYEISTLVPSVTLKDFNGIDDIIAQYSTQIADMDNADSIKDAVFAINNVIVYPSSSSKGQGSIFSFNKRLEMGKLMKQQMDEGYNQVASTLYAAILMAGIDQNTITRSPHEETADYIQPGLDACILSDSEDLNFQNTFTSAIVVNAEVKGSKVIVSILGKKQSKFTTALKTEVEQRYNPTVINMENQDLKRGQKKMVSPGKEGLKVNVYRVTMSGKYEIDKQLLYYDQYKPIDAVVQIGPDTDWHEGGNTK